jgi:hypothetical protein
MTTPSSSKIECVFSYLPKETFYRACVKALFPHQDQFPTVSFFFLMAHLHLFASQFSTSYSMSLLLSGSDADLLAQSAGFRRDSPNLTVLTFFSKTWWFCSTVSKDLPLSESEQQSPNALLVLMLVSWLLNPILATLKGQIIA